METPALRHPVKLLTALLLGSLILTGRVVAADAEIRYDDRLGLVSVQATEVPLGDLLVEVGDAAGFEVVLHSDAEAPVTVDLQNIAIKNAIRRLLGRRGYTLQEDPQTRRPVKIWVMSAADPGAMDRAREARRVEARREQAEAKIPEAGTPLIPEETIEQLEQLGVSDEVTEKLQGLGLTQEKREELMRALGQINAGNPQPEQGE